MMSLLNSTNAAMQKQNITEQLDPLFTHEQLQWISSIELPRRLFLKSATEFDDQFLYLHKDWRFRYSGENKNITFNKGKSFRELPPETIKLIKHLTIKYIEENSASTADKFANNIATSFAEVGSITRDNLLAKLHLLVTKTKRKYSDNIQFYCTLFALRKLDRLEFFKSSDKKQDLEDLLLELPRPRNGNFGVYQNLDLVIPDEVCLMIENGVQRWASKLTPSLKTKEEKIAHLAKIKNAVNINKLRDCVTTGIVYYVGARPVQLAKMAGGDFVIDSENEHGSRFSILIPYAKKSRLTMERIRVAIPEELGKLIMLYMRIAKVGKEDALLPKKSTSNKPVNDSIKRMLLVFSPKEIQEAVKNNDYELPVYTASLFRHNVGHRMAMSGASAYEIAYILGHSSLVVAERYIAATPDMGDIREQALGRNPAFKNMIVLMLTGNLVHSSDWTGRWVAGSIGGKLHHHLGGCDYEEGICPFSQGRACYGCLYFKPFTDGKHLDVLDSFNDELIEVRNIADDTATVNHPLLKELTRRKQHVIQVIARIEMA